MGSTGSIGTQTLDVIRKNADKLQVVSLVAFSRKEQLLQQVDEFCPEYHALICEKGANCLIEAVQNCDIAVVATRGITALECVLYCLENGVDVALANKEVLVCAGQLVKNISKKSKLLTIDSEHCAIQQCLDSRQGAKPVEILLTASGGPFKDLPKVQLSTVTPAQALKHPNWNMGYKITADSATMMNKSLEVLEAHWLFDMPLDKIKIVVHPQSIVHSMVKFSDGSVMAQLAQPDMRLPIQIALLGNGGDLVIDHLDFDKIINLSFHPCDNDKFPCATLGHIVGKSYPLAPTVMNGANDVCVDAFVNGNMGFCQFYNVITDAIAYFTDDLASLPVTLQNIKNADAVAREYTKKLIYGEIC